jgi:hypothetical protein
MCPNMPILAASSAGSELLGSGLDSKSALVLLSLPLLLLLEDGLRTVFDVVNLDAMKPVMGLNILAQL